MRNLHRNLLIAVLVAAFSSALAQNPKAVEDSVNHYLNQMATAPENYEKLEAHHNLNRFLSRQLLKPEVFQHDFAGVQSMAVLNDFANNLRTFSWYVPLKNEAPQYGMVIATYNPKKDFCTVHSLQQKETAALTEFATYSERNWPGMLYFKMVPIGKRANYYLLFGWEDNDELSDKKVVDVLHFSSGKPRLGKPIFSAGGKSKNRLVFEYREGSVFSVDYYPETDMVVYDNLGPPHPSLEGKPAHYVPLGSFGGYKRGKSKWEHQSEVDFKRGKHENDKIFKDPQGADMNRRREKQNPLTGE